MTDPMILPGTATSDIETLRLQLIAGSSVVQQQIISQLENLGYEGFEVLMEFLLKRRDDPATWVDGKAYQVLHNSGNAKAKEFLHLHFREGVVPLKSERDIDYLPLQQLLAARDFQAGDRMTLEKMCLLAGSEAVQRKWLYFSEVENFPSIDLQTIDKLWTVHSEDKFGFSVQREIWLSLGKNWDTLWKKINWKNGNNWTRYPNEFTWNLDAPRGHLPLSNQLRGVRVISSLFSHSAWTTSSTS